MMHVKSRLQGLIRTFPDSYYAVTNTSVAILRCTSHTINQGKMMSNQVDKNISAVKHIYDAALASVEPTQMVRNNLSYQNGMLQIGRKESAVAINIEGRDCHIVAFGKAVIGMITAVDSILGNKITSGIASIPKNIQKELQANGRSDLIPVNGSRVQLCEGAFLNIPDEECINASQRIQHMVNGLGEKDVLITLTSGGGSALLCLPVPPLSLGDLAQTTKYLGRAGASIVELNTVRKHLEILKGGGLAQLAYPAQVVNLVLSDVVGDPLDIIASGPTLPDTSTAEDALNILRKYLNENEVLLSVRDVLQHGRKKLYLDSSGSLTSPTNVHNVVIGSNSIALQAAVDRCHNMSVVPVLLTTQLCGNATQIGKEMAELTHRILNWSSSSNYTEGLFNDVLSLEDDLNSKIRRAVTESKLPLCLLFGGETTVEVKGTGQGGRNQEMCLSALIVMNSLNMPSHAVTFASIGTDGQDGPTDAAGAIVAPHCSDMSHLDPLPFLQNNDSYTYFSQLEQGKFLYNTGLTGTNVMDVGIVLINLSSANSIDSS